MLTESGYTQYRLSKDINRIIINFNIDDRLVFESC